MIVDRQQQQQHHEQRRLPQMAQARLQRQLSATRMPPPLKKSRGGPSLSGSVHVRAKSYRRMAEECWTSPVSDDEVTPELKLQYDEIKDSILSIPWTSGVVAIRRYFQELVACIQLKAAIHPTLARVVARDMNHSSMLTLLCDKAHTPLAHTTMKFLIERNPSALLWKRDNWEKMGIEYSMPIYTIVNHHAHHVLLPWIAQHYPWVLEHPDCQAKPPTFDFIAQCVNGIALNSALIRQYFTIYPQALRHVDHAQKSTPLHYFLGGFTECRLDLFQWLATKKEVKGCGLLRMVHVTQGLWVDRKELAYQSGIQRNPVNTLGNKVKSRRLCLAIWMLQHPDCQAKPPTFDFIAR